MSPLPRPKLVLAVLAALVLLSACDAGDGDNGEAALVPADNLASLVLQPRDLPDGFVRFDHGPIGLTDLPSGPRRGIGRFGRRGGWKARYNRPGAATAEGPLVVESLLDVFKTEEGAQQDFDAYGEELEHAIEDAGAGRSIEAPAIGEESRAIALEQSAQGGEVVLYRIAWRYRNVTASLLVQGFEDKVALEDAVKLARKQQAHIAEAPSQ